MPSIDDIYSGDSLKTDDIKGREPVVIIKSVTPRDFTDRDGKIKKKLVLGFERTNKTLVVNKVNGNRIGVLHGKDYTQWIGKTITLFVDPFVEFGGKIVPAIRVKPPTYEAPRQESPAPQQAAPFPSQQGFVDPDPMPALDRNDKRDIPF
jgi:hypothetical protein